MKPFFMSFTTGGNLIDVNMSQVCYITPNDPTKPDSPLSVLTFNNTINECPAYIMVDQSYFEIRARKEWIND